MIVQQLFRITRYNTLHFFHRIGDRSVYRTEKQDLDDIAIVSQFIGFFLYLFAAFFSLTKYINSLFSTVFPIFNDFHIYVLTKTWLYSIQAIITNSMDTVQGLDRIIIIARTFNHYLANIFVFYVLTLLISFLLVKYYNLSFFKLIKRQAIYGALALVVILVGMFHLYVVFSQFLGSSKEIFYLS